MQISHPRRCSVGSCHSNQSGFGKKPLCYTGTHCEVDIDECDPDPCHYGSCKDGVATFTCLCQPGYTGHHCETNINECHSQPCRHGGTCQDPDHRPTPPPGPNCEVNLDDCASSPCDSGTCLDKIDGYECACEPGYTGRGSMCNVNIDECAANPCHNGGTCEDGINGFTCHCPEGYHDPTCLSEVNECNSSPCVHGVCRDSLNGYKCDCEPGWSGTNCDINTNECESNPCVNGGTCKDMTSGYVCTCREGFSGWPSCPLPDPCHNGGSCTDGVNTAFCDCLPGFQGAFCEEDINECASNPCHHGANCTDCVAALKKYNLTHATSPPPGRLGCPSPSSYHATCHLSSLPHTAFQSGSGRGAWPGAGWGSAVEVQCLAAQHTGSCLPRTRGTQL
uniref:EGF-like domain-containing protein n=1 Tax=Spermophilus dauricus TaxID=99837 RepID=A0A8C9P121_SPEDA